MNTVQTIFLSLTDRDGTATPRLIPATAFLAHLHAARPFPAMLAGQVV